MKMLIAKGSKKREIETPFSLFFFSRSELKHMCEVLQDELADDMWRDGISRWIPIIVPESPEPSKTMGRAPEPWED